MKDSLIKVKVIPNAGKRGIAAMGGGIIKVKVNAPPERGRANEEVIEVLSEILGIRKKMFSIVKGDKSREKTLSVRWKDKKSIMEVLNERIEENDN